MATARQLPSGNWNVQAYKTVDGQKYKRSFTAETKAEAEFLAERWQQSVAEGSRPGNRTLRQLCEDYIALKEPTLSPTTLAGYRKVLRNNFQKYMNVKVNALTKVKCQQMIADESRRGLSPKSVANAWGLISSALKMYDIHFDVRLPEKADHVVQILSPEELMPRIIGTDVELPCLLAMWCGMTMSEIKGARLSDIRAGVLYINQVQVYADRKTVYKANGKEERRTRAVALPEYVKELLPAEGEYVVPMHRETVYKHFKRLVPEMTFHQLRHVFASTGAMLGIAPRIMQDMGGWKTSHTMEKVYQHTFTKERVNAQNSINEYMEKFIKDV